VCSGVFRTNAEQIGHLATVALADICLQVVVFGAAVWLCIHSRIHEVRQGWP
jgi:hypothetical protein